MTTRLEARLGAAKDVGTAYVSVGTAASDFNLLIHLAATLACAVEVYVAAASWTTGAPTGSDLVAKLAYDMPLVAGEVAQITGVIMLSGEKLVVQSSVAASVDVLAQGVAITP